MGEPHPSSSDPIQAARPSALPLSTGSTGDASSIYFFACISRIPLANSILQAYSWAKASSEIVKYGAETIESYVKMVSRPVINRLPITKLDEFARKQLDRFGTPNQTPSATPNHTKNSPGYPRVRNIIIGGLAISYEEALAWLKREHGITLDPDHSEDLSIPWYLSDAIEEHDYPYDIEQVLPQGTAQYETLLVTRWASGPFVNVGPSEVEEILQDDLKELLKPGALEDEARDIIFRDLGITTTGYKCYFSIGTRFTARYDNDDSGSV